MSNNYLRSLALYQEQTEVKPCPLCNQNMKLISGTIFECTNCQKTFNNVVSVKIRSYDGQFRV